MPLRAASPIWTLPSAVSQARCSAGKSITSAAEWKTLPTLRLPLAIPLRNLSSTPSLWASVPYGSAALWTALLLKKALNSAAKYGLAGMPKTDMLRMACAMVRYGMSFKDGVALYGKYVGNWGGEATVWRFDAISGDQVVASRTCCPSDKLHLEAAASHTALHEGATYDMAAVRITVRDEFGNIAPYAQLPVKLALEGPAQLVGPDVVTAEGGMCGTYIRTVGEKGSVKLTISSWGLEDVTIVFTVA